MKVTMEDVARVAGVSKATVSRVLNNKAEGVGQATRERVRAVMEDLGYVPDPLSRSSVRGKTNTIGLIVPDITNPFYAHLVQAVSATLIKNNYTMMLANTRASFQNEENQLAAFMDKQVDGIILTSSSNRIDEVRCMIFKYNVPLVMLDRSVTVASIMGSCPGVFIDNEYALFASTEYLIKSGHYRIAYLTGEPEVSTTQERIAGYLAAHRQHRIPFREELLLHGAYNYDSGYLLCQKLLNSGAEFTALLMGNDMMAIGAITCLKERGIRIPEDIELMGFDNIAFSHITEPSLSTVEQPVNELGARAAQIVLDLIEGKQPEAEFMRLVPKLIFRQTTRQQDG